MNHRDLIAQAAAIQIADMLAEHIDPSEARQYAVSDFAQVLDRVEADRLVGLVETWREATA